VLQSAVAAVFDGDPRNIKTYISLAEGRQALLEARALDCGRKLLAEKPSAIKRRWDIYWEVWEAEDEALHLAAPPERRSLPQISTFGEAR